MFPELRVPDRAVVQRILVVHRELRASGEQLGGDHTLDVPVLGVLERSELSAGLEAVVDLMSNCRTIFVKTSHLLRNIKNITISLSLRLSRLRGGEGLVEKYSVGAFLPVILISLGG